nr:MAG TPA: hypothetical protein [Caudoviricetes sp.]
MNKAPCIRMVLFRVWTEGGRQQKTPGAEALGVLVREAGLEPAKKRPKTLKIQRFF